MSRFGLLPAFFHDLTPREFGHAMTDNLKCEENRQRFELEKMRLQTLYLVNLQIKEPVTEPAKLMPFAWDVQEENDKTGYVPNEQDWDYYDKLAEKWAAKL